MFSQKIFKEIFVSTSITKFVYPSYISTHMHILIWLYDIFLHGSIVWFSNICITSMSSYFSLLELHISFLEVGRKRRHCYDVPWWGIIDHGATLEYHLRRSLSYVFICKNYKNYASWWDSDDLVSKPFHFSTA